MKRVYFIKPIGFDGPVKIGCSDMPEVRRESLAIWSPFPLEIVAEIAGDFYLERQFHALFREQYLRSEWFEVTPELNAVIASIAAGTFDIGTLPKGRCLPKHRSPNQGRKWTDEEKATNRRRNALRKAFRETGYHLPAPHTEERVKTFLAAPCAATGGVTTGQLDAERHRQHAERCREVAERHLQMAADNDEKAIESARSSVVAVLA